MEDDEDDDAVDREHEMAIACSIFRRFHNIHLARGGGAVPFCLISDPRRLISLTETFPFQFSRISDHPASLSLSLLSPIPPLLSMSPVNRKARGGEREN